MAGEPIASQSVERLFSIQGVFTLGMLVLLQAVLGFDNLLYISINNDDVGPWMLPRDRTVAAHELPYRLIVDDWISVGVF